MAEEVFIKESVLFDIADAIREKNGRKDKYMPYQLSSAILELPSSKLSDLETYMRSGQILYSGYEGDCPWVITDHGTLVMGDPAKTTYLSEEYLSNPWSAYNTVVKNIIVNGHVVVPARMTNLFSGMSELWLIFNIGNLDTSLVESYQGWFQGCSSINTVDLSSWDASNVRVINWMFKNCSSLVEVRLPFIPNECEMIGTFSECGFVKFRFYGNKVIRSSNMSQTFYNCPNLVEANLSGIDISKIKYMESTFENCPNLTTVNIEPVFAPNLTSMKNMFKNCYALKKNPKNLFWKVPSLKDISFMFHFCISLEEFEFDTPVFSIENISGMFSECYQLKKIDWTNWINFFYAGKETLHINSPFHNCWNLQEILTGSRTMLSTSGWQSAHYDAYSPKQDFQTIEGMKTGLTKYSAVHTATTSSALIGYNISGTPGYELIDAVEAGLRIDWRQAYNKAITFEVMDLTTGNMVTEGVYSNMNTQFTPPVNLPYQDYVEDVYIKAYMQDLYKLAVENGMNKDAAASLTGLDKDRNGYLKSIGLALPYYMVEQNTGIRTFQLTLNKPCHYIREDCLIKPEPYYEYPAMHNFLSLNFSDQFAAKVVKHIEWRTNVQFPLKNELIAATSLNQRATSFHTYHNSLSWDYDHDTKTLIVATPEDEFYLMPDSSGMFSGMIYLEDISFKNINTKYCRSFDHMFYDCSRLKEIRDFNMNPAIASEELIPFQDICDETLLEDAENYRKTQRGNTIDYDLNNSEGTDAKYYDWSYIYGMDTMFKNCSDLRVISFENVDWGRVKSVNKALKTYSSTLRKALTDNIPTANEIIINKSYEKTGGYEQLSTDEDWYRLPLGNDNEVIISKYDKNKTFIIPNYNITVNGLIDGPGKYIRERAITQELLERTYGFDYNIFNSGMALRNMIENYLVIQGVSIQEIKSIDLRTRIVSPHGTQYITTLNDITYEGPYLYYNPDTKKVIIQTKADNFIIKDNAEYTFYDMRELRRINGFNKIQWENITNISHLFDGCLSLFTIDLSNLILDTLTDTSYMFNNCELFDYLDLSHFNFSEVIDMEYMFNGCKNLIQLILPENIDTSKVTDMTHLFCNCEKLGLINFKDFDTDKVIDMSYMFYNCKSLIYADLSNFSTLNVQDMSYMFTGCESLREMNISSIIFSRKKDYIFAGLPEKIYTTLPAQFNSENIYFNNLFEGCDFTQIDCSNFNWHMARDVKRMFKDCINLQSLSLGDVESPWLYSTYEMFANCESLTSIIFDRWRTRGVTDISYMFYNCKSLVELDFAKIEFHGRLIKAASLFENCESISVLDFSNTYLYCNFDRIFYNCKSLVSIIGLHGQYVRSLGQSFYYKKPELTGRFFYNCESLKDLDLSYMNFSDVYNYTYMFYNCRSLEEINLQYSNSFNGPCYDGMFKECVNVKYIILPEKINLAFRRYYVSSGWTNYVDKHSDNQFKQMFYNCKSLIDISNLQKITTNGQFDKSSNNEGQMVIWNLSQTFYNCENLEAELDFAKLIPKTDPNAGYNWITGSNKSWHQYGGYDMRLTSLKETFYNCHKLTTIKFPDDRPTDITNYNITKEFEGTFDGCYNLKNLVLVNLKFGTWRGTTTEYTPNEDTSNSQKYWLTRMFKDCRSLKQIDLSTWMFQTYHNIAQTTGLPYNNNKNLGLTTEDIGNMSSMFENCYELEKIIWPKGIKSGGVAPTYDLVTKVFPFMYIKNADKMFKNCYKLTEIEQECYPEIIFNTVVSAYQMMMNCKSIETNIVLLCSNYLRDMREIFSGCESMTYLDFRKHRTLFNYTEKENGLYNCLAMQQMDMGQFYDGRTRRFYLDIDNEGNYSLRIGWIAGARGDEYIYLPVTPGYDDPPNYRPYIGLDVAFWNELVQRAKSTYGKYIWIAVGGWANQNANSSIGSSTIRLLRDRPLYYSNWTTYQGGWVVPSSGGIAYEWDRAPLMNIDDNAYIIQRKDNADITTTIIWNLNINGFRIDNIDDTTKNIIITSHNGTYSHTYGNNGYISSTENYRPHFIWKSDRTVNYEIGQQVKVDLWNDNDETEYYLTLTNQMINFLNIDKDIYDYYFISAIGSSGSWGTDLWRFPRGIEFDYIEQNDGIKINFLNNIKNYYFGGGTWDGTRPVQWYALLETEKCPYVNLNEWNLEEDIYPMQFPKDMYTGVQNMYTVWNGDIPIKVETYYDFPLLPEKYNSRLVSGSEFAYTIKRMANGANVTDGNYEDTKIKHIIFENGIQKSGTAIGSQGSPVVANWDNDTGTITITFEIEAPIILNSNSSNMFYRLKSLQSIEGLDILDTSEVINANNMFKETGTSSLELDLRTWDMSNCTSMQLIFQSCTAKLVNITDWDITSLIDIPSWDKDFSFFYTCTIEILEAANLDFINITNLRAMLYHSTFTNINVANWNVSNITSLRATFRLSTFTNGLDLSTWDVSSVQNMINTFADIHAPWILFDTWDTSTVTDMTHMFGGCYLPEVNISTWDVSHVTTMYQMFYDTKVDLTTIILSNFNTQACKNMSLMFQSCKATSITLSDFNIESCLTMYRMFYSTPNLQTLNIMNEWKFHPNNDIREMFRDSPCAINNLERFNVSALISMYRMFYGYKGTELIFTNWDTSHCLYMSQMFAECTNLITLKIQTFDTSKVRCFEAMFYNCSKLEIFETNNFVLNANDTRNYWTVTSSITGNYDVWNRSISTSSYRDWGSFNSGRTPVGEMFLNITIPLNISHWDVSNQIVFSTMFGGYKGTIVDLSEWNVQESTTNIIWRMMFNNCNNLQYAYLTSFWTENVIDIAAMFANCTSLIKAYFRENKIVLPEINTNTYGMYVGCTCDMHVEEWDLSKITTLNSLFRSYRGTTIDLSSWAGKLENDQISGMNATFYDCNNLVNLDLSGLANLDSVKDFGSCFAYMSNMITFDLTYLNTSSATSFYHMFYYSSKIQTLDFSNFNTEKVTNMEWLFAEDYALQSLDLTTFNTSKCTNFRRMFWKCQSMTELLIPNFNTSLWSGDNAEHMFYQCWSLTELYLPDTFTLINNTSSEGMFRECKVLQTLRIPSTFGGENLQRVDRMFQDCWALEELILPDSFISSVCTNFQYMFQDCHSLRVLTQHFNMAGAYSTSYMMKNCYALEELNTYQNSTEKRWLFSNVMHCEGMFDGCHSLKSLDLSSISFSRVGQNNNSGVWVGARSLNRLFADCYALEELEISGLFIKGTGISATSINYMFVNCRSLKTLNISNAKFFSLNSNGAQYLFQGCNSLESIDLRYSKFIGTTNMIGWFQNCYTLKGFYWSGLTFSTADKDFTPIVNMSYTFQGCKAIETVGFAENSTTADYEVDVNMTVWNVKNVTTTEGMFADCDNLITVDFAYSNFTKIQNSKTMFKNCISLESIVFPEDYNKNVNLGTYIYYDSMFEGCSSIDYIEFPNITIANQYYYLNMPNMFKNCTSLQTIEFRNAKQLYSYNNYAGDCLYGCSSLENIYFSECDGWTGGNSLIRWICNGANSSGSFVTLTVEGTINNNFNEFIRSAIKVKYIHMVNWIENNNGEITLHETNKPSSLYYAFAGTGVHNLKDIIMNFANVTNYTYCFHMCSYLTVLDTSIWNMREQADCNFSCAFREGRMTTIDATNFSVDKINNMIQAFEYCSNLVSMIVPQFRDNFSNICRYAYNITDITFLNYNDTEKIRTFLSGMSTSDRTLNVLLDNFTGTKLSFNGYRRIKSFNIINTDTSRITNLNSCFRDTGLSSFDFDLLDVSNVTNMAYMFCNCYSLSNIHIGEINTPLLTTIAYMFYRCSALTQLDFSKWTCSAVQDFSYIFESCTALTTLDISGWDFNSITNSNCIFRYISNLRTIYARGAFKDFKSDANTYLSSTGIISIYIPLSLLPRYKTAYQWKNVLGALKDGSDKELVALQLTSNKETINCYKQDTYARTAQFTVSYIDPDDNIDVDPQYRGVIWSVEGNAIIDENGLLTLDNAIPGEVLTVTAISVYDNSIYINKIIRVELIQQEYAIDLNNNEWADSGTQVDGRTVYYSNKHTNQHNTTDTCKINIDGYETFILKYCSYGEPNYDYVIIKLDAQPTTSDYNYTTYGNSNMTYKTATFNNLEGIPHTIYISYRKDGSVNSNTDKGYFYIPE